MYRERIEERFCTYVYINLSFYFEAGLIGSVQAVIRIFLRCVLPLGVSHEATRVGLLTVTIGIDIVVLN